MTTCQDPLCGSSPCVLAGAIPAEGPLINRVNARASTFHVDLHRLSFFCYNWSMMQRAFAGGAPALWHGVACSCSSWMQADFLPSWSPSGIAWDLSGRLPPKLHPQGWELLAACERWGGHPTVSPSSQIPAWDWSLSYWFYSRAMLCRSVTRFS